MYSSNDAPSNDTKDNDLMTSPLVFVLKIEFSDLVTTGGIVFHKHMYF